MLFILPAGGALGATIPGPLVEAGWLKANLDKVVVLDVRSDLKSFTAKPIFKIDKKTGKKKFRAVGGHIKGAHLVNFKKLRGVRKIGGRDVTRMAVKKADFEKLMQGAGLNKNDAIVIVSKGMSAGDMTMATRLYWNLKYLGHDDMAILDGGMAQWIVDGNEVVSTVESHAKGNWVARAERDALLATSDEVQLASNNNSATIIDARPLDQYFGIWHKSYVFKPGHVPGAKAFPVSLMLNSKPPVKFLPADKIRQLLLAMKVNPEGASVSYCNSGHLASGGWFIMHEILGNKGASMYDGSMHQWTLEGRPTSAMKAN